MDVAAQPHPNPQPHPHHRKIELQSHADLTFLQQNLAQSALQKLDLHFPPLAKPATHILLGDNNNNPQQENGGTNSNPNNNDSNEKEQENEETDPMRLHIRTLISEFLTQTWTSAQQNISVNGLSISSLPIPSSSTLAPARSPQPQTAQSQSNGVGEDATATAEEKVEREGIDYTYSSFDPKLQQKVASLYGELESLTAQVSKLRRDAPRVGAETYQRELDERMRGDELVWEEQQQQRQQQRRVHNGNKNDNDNDDGDDGDRMELDLEDVRQGWNEDVREMYEIGLAELAGLAGVGKNFSSSSDRTSIAGPSGGLAVGERGASQRTRGSSLTETVGKAHRARTVAMEME